MLFRSQSYQSSQPIDFAEVRPGRVVIDVGTIGLVREVPDDQVLAFDENAVPILNANSMQGSMQFGFKAMLDVRDVQPWFGGTDLQLGYFGINSLDAGATVNALEVNSIFFQVFPANPPTSFNFNYSSNLYSSGWYWPKRFFLTNEQQHVWWSVWVGSRFMADSWNKLLRFWKSWRDAQRS